MYANNVPYGGIDLWVKTAEPSNITLSDVDYRMDTRTPGTNYLDQNSNASAVLDET